MEGEGSSSSVSNATRWTCEACGCHTNTNETNSLSCGVCGTRRGPSLMRRVGGHSASARLFARSFAARRGAVHGDHDFDDDEVMDHLDPDEMGDDEEEHAAAALALEVAGVTGAARAANAHNHLGRRLRSLAGGGPPSAMSGVLGESAENRPPPEEILLAATENAVLYKPTWADMSQLSARSRHSNGIILGTGGLQNVAHLPLGVGEGRPVRTVEPFPRGALPPRNLSPGTVGGLTEDRKRRRSFGFRVVFDHPRRDAGFDMGGCYFVGVTTQAFTAFGERNALQQSRFCWGIEDHGNKFEGRLQSHTRVPGRGGSSNYGVEISRSEASRNADNVLFGSREVITVVADLETRTLTYWRDGRLLGTLVSNLPRTGNIYPIVVPFNAGVSVAISAMDSSPLPLLQSFVTDWKRTQQEREDLHRRKLILQRSVLIQSGKPTYELLNILKIIFSWYIKKGAKVASNNISIDPVAAFRLWYRCGMKLCSLQDLLEKKIAEDESKAYSTLSVTLEDFIRIITQIVGEEELSFMAGGAMVGIRLPGTSLQVLRNDSAFEVGDIVELVDSYERFGDASSGPLQPGDRGKVVEIQQGQRGEQHSIRVIHNGRRWGYHPQALLSERSGLIDSPAVWFIRKLLRLHGFDHTNLQPIWGKPVTTTSWQIGDLVVPQKTQSARRQSKRENNEESTIYDKSLCMGRIVAESSSGSSSQQASRGRESGIVSVEFIDPSFGTAAGVISGNSNRTNTTIQTKKIRVNRLMHTTFFHGTSVMENNGNPEMDIVEDSKISASSLHEETEGEGENLESTSDSEAEKKGIEIAGIARLEPSAIELVTKECEKSSASIAGMFAAGLPDAVISAIDHAVYEVTDPESGRDISPAVSSLGKLTVLIAKYLFCDEVVKSKNTNSVTALNHIPSQDETDSSRSPRSEQGESSPQALQQAARRLHVQPDSPENALSHHVQDLIRGLNNAGGLSSTQQGRSMLLALMSSARMNNAAFPGSHMAENHLDFGLGFDGTSQVVNNANQLMFSQLGIPPYFAFSQAGAMPQASNWAETNPFSGIPRPPGRFGVPDTENTSNSFNEVDSSQDSPQNAAASRRAGVSTLESVLRGRNQQSSTKSASKGIGKVVPPAVKSLIKNGLLQNNAQWVAASIETLRNSSHSLSGSTFSAIKKAVDEDGATLLLLAVSLGCPGKVLNNLIRAGASVGEKEIFQAALTNQAESLLVLLRHSVYSKGSLDVRRCSAEVADVLEKATVRQKAQEENMRKDGGNFVSMVVGKLFNLGFLCRLHKSKATDACSKVVSDILVGNVLLHAMHESQRKALSSSTSSSSPGNGDESAAVDLENGRVPLFDPGKRNTSDGTTEQDPGSSREGLLEVIPADILRESLQSDDNDTVESQLTDALLLVESYLWSKAISDVSVGLSLVNSLLRKVPAVRCSSLIERFGIRDLASSHEVLASDARADAIENFARARAQLPTKAKSASSPPQSASSVTSSRGCTVMCPMQHVAELHLTKHSSFRCDLCGKGVERGRPMHGCRQCDWDACEKCTDKAEGGIIKWGCILEMAAECHAWLSETELPEVKTNNDEKSTVYCETTRKLKELATLLRQRNCKALEELASLLLSPGRMTMHEFATMILPSLHSALIEKPVGRSESHLGIEMTSNRRNKKPRVGCLPHGVDDTLGREAFCRKVVQFFIETSEERKNGPTVNSEMGDQLDADDTGNRNENISLMHMEDQNDDGDDDEESDDVSAELRKDENADEANFKIRTPEILRRLHEVLAFHENVNVISNTRNGSGNASVGATGGDLQSLTQPLEIELLPSAIGSRNYCSTSTATSNRASTGMIVHVEPLMLLADLHQHLLRTCRLSHPTYARYCRRLALEQAIIVERPVSIECTGEDSKGCRRLAQIIGFDENTGAHILRYATRLTKFAVLHGELLDFRSSGAPIPDQIEFGGAEVMLVLAARNYQVIHRNYQSRDSEGMAPFDMETELLLSDADVLLGSDIPTDNYSASPACSLAGNDTSANLRASALCIGMRVESNCTVRGSRDGPWGAYTIISVRTSDESVGQSPQSNVDNCRYVLVSDIGEVHKDVPSSRIRGHAALLSQSRTQRRRDRSRQDTFASDVRSELAQGRAYPVDRAFPFFHVRRPGSDLDPRSETPPNQKVGVLKRTWSALSPIEDMNPIELNPNLPETLRPTKRLNHGMVVTCSIPGRETDILVETSFAEHPPPLRAELSAHECLPTIDTGSFEETTIYSALNQLFKRNENTQNKSFPCGDRIKLYYNVAVHDSGRKSKVMRRAFEKDVAPCPTFSPNMGKSLLLPDSIGAEHELNMNNPLLTSGWNLGDDRSRKHHATNDDDVTEYQDSVLCDGLNETSVCCMEIMCVLAEFSEIYGLREMRKAAKEAQARTTNKSKGKKDAAFVISPIESERLTKKLVEQLEDPLTVVGGALPGWCTIAPTYAPQIFSYASRRLLLERAAFGVSRSALKQQEAKVAVAPLRQRMASLRGRAVELVGEAFSGGAEDPTALQLQADELYGMEEALAARVTAAFRAQRWDERSLQCAKAAVRRDMLLSDAAAIMDRYANGTQVRRRRLEVRFDGESGFDAASGDEAGVTRGFYADVAESLLSCDHVSSVFCKPIGGSESACAFVSNVARLEESPSEVSSHASKLPLWIPDMDSSRQVVIPTPRADPGSGLGVYPRPLLPHHPQFNAVLDQFRFMGRLFAAAMRDGFILPLPLSTSFLKLVQCGHGVTSLSSVPSTSIASYPTSTKSNSNSMLTPVLDRNPSVEDMSVSDHSTSGNLVGTSTCGTATLQGKLSKLALNSSDLPRPGFLGGEIYAVESFVCAALDKVDEAEPPLSREALESEYREIASDKNFARKAMGKSFDCSFEEYFEDKTFVDPLDPAQGEDAMPLCPNGHLRSVTIHNVREWVTLAKEFVLHEGVILQARSFRYGVEDFFSADYLRLFTADELQHDVCGGGDNVDKWDEAAVRSIFKLDGGKGAAEALVAVAAMGGEGGAALSRRFGPASPTIGHLVKTLLEASPTQRRQFLSFVTSVPIVTPGQIEVVPMVSPSGEFLPMRDPGCLPRANTCARRLYLPKFESYETFSQVLWAVVREESKFKGFYEWRG